MLVALAAIHWPVCFRHKRHLCLCAAFRAGSIVHLTLSEFHSIHPLSVSYNEKKSRYTTTEKQFPLYKAMLFTRVKEEGRRL